MTASERLIALATLTETRGALITSPSNMFYVTEGYTGEGAVLLSGKRRVIITDFRYTEQAEQQAPGFAVVMTDKDNSQSKWLKKFCEEDGIEALLFEDGYMTVTAYRALKDALGENVVLSSLKGAPEKLREDKTEREISLIKKACEITSKAFDVILGKIHEGMTEKELQLELDYTMMRLGGTGLAFDTIIAAGEHGSLPHAIPGERVLRKGDMITMDYGCSYGGYCSDMTRTVALGTPSDTMLKVYNTVLEAQLMCVDALAAGKNCFDIDKIARDHIDAAGYAGRFGHGLGHSLGIDIHEQPRLSPTCHEDLRAGVLMTVEPGIYLPGVGGVRIEDTCLIRETDGIPLTSAPKELIIL